MAQSTPTPSRLRGPPLPRSTGERKPGWMSVGAGKAQRLRQRSSSPPSTGEEVARGAGRSGGRCALRGSYAIALPTRGGEQVLVRTGLPPVTWHFLIPLPLVGR